MSLTYVSNSRSFSKLRLSVLSNVGIPQSLGNLKRLFKITVGVSMSNGIDSGARQR